jgi:hypothetical protein
VPNSCFIFLPFPIFELLNNNIKRFDMCEHENVGCPRCRANFECKVGSISLCQCSTVSLTVGESQYIGENYKECLCATCMVEMKKEYNAKQLAQKFNQISTLFNKKQ